MREPVHVARAEDKTAAQLEGIPSEFVLRMTGGFGTGARLGIITTQQMKQICAFELHYGIGLAFFVDEKREGDARFLAKGARVETIAQTDSRQVRPAIAEGLLVRAQLRDVLAAEDSTVMPQKNYHCRLADP